MKDKKNMGKKTKILDYSQLQEKKPKYKKFYYLFCVCLLIKVLALSAALQASDWTMRIVYIVLFSLFEWIGTEFMLIYKLAKSIYK